MGCLGFPQRNCRASCMESSLVWVAESYWSSALPHWGPHTFLNPWRGPISAARRLPAFVDTPRALASSLPRWFCTWVRAASSQAVIVWTDATWKVGLLVLPFAGTPCYSLSAHIPQVRGVKVVVFVAVVSVAVAVVAAVVVAVVVGVLAVSVAVAGVVGILGVVVVAVVVGFVGVGAAAAAMRHVVVIVSIMIVTMLNLVGLLRVIGHKNQRHVVEADFWGSLHGPLNWLNAILSLRQSPSTAIGLCDRHCDWEALSHPISHPHAGRSSQPPRSKPLGRLYSVENPFKAKQKRDRGRDSRPRLNSQPQGATKNGIDSCITYGLPIINHFSDSFIWKCSGTKQSGVLAKVFLQSPVSRPRKQKMIREIGPRRTFGTQSATAKRGVHFAKNPSKKTLFLAPGIHRDCTTLFVRELFL